jgi:hypothetical protein
MTQSIPLSDLESSPAAKFTEIGDGHKGRITGLAERPQTDINTGAPRTFQDGSPMMQWVISLQKPDGEVVALYAKGGKFRAVTGTGESMLTAIGLAVRAANASGVDVGGELAVVHTGLGEQKPGKAAPKLFTASYRPPATASIPADLFDQP